MPQDFSGTGLGSFVNSLKESNTIPLTALTRKPFVCPGDTNLYPTHPSHITKVYHSYETARYDHHAIDARDRECLISQLGDPTKQTRADIAARIIAQAEARGRRVPCLKADVAHRGFLSDTYIDACGNYYRGVKRLAFLKQDETMGTLWSPGRNTMNIGPTLQDGQYDGHTYAVSHTEFEFLAELLPGDMGKIEQARAAARSTHTLDAAGRLFSVKQ